jgi:PTS system mannose-specific IIA component
MIGMVLVSHGRLADEMRLAMEHVVGPQRAVATVCIGPDDDMESRRQDIRACVAAVDQGDGVVILTDMFGGTPSNLATAVAEEPSATVPVEVIAGVNLPLMVKLARLRGSQPLAEAVEHAMSAGRRYISCATPARCAPPEPMGLCVVNGKLGTS